jgi:uncharacterized protein YbaP (TraB family)
MQRWSLGILMSFLSLISFSQNTSKQDNENTLLWQISGNGLAQPSYLFGTIHLLCSNDAVLSDSLKGVIARCKEVYLEVNMDNLFEMLGILKYMKMRGDTTLSDLLSKEDYEKVKKYYEDKGSMLPFSMMETYKPMLAMSTLEESAVPCDSPVAMEQLIMQEAKKHKKQIGGLETIAFQAGIFDSIPYKLQAQILVHYIDSASIKDKEEEKEFNELVGAYKKQDLAQLEQLINKEDLGISNFAEILLYNRNRNWVEKLKTLMPGKTLLIAVGAGHLPGEKGVINLLRKAGYKVKPVKNNMKKPGMEI